MVQREGSHVDLERTDQYAPAAPSDRVDLEATDAYLRQAKADAHRSKARAANWVAIILVLGLVLSLPFYVAAIGWQGSEASSAHLERIFLRLFVFFSG